MIDPIKTWTSATSAIRTDKVKAVSVAEKPVTVAASTEQPSTAAISVQATVDEMASRPPVDKERVDIIRSAIARGRFPITPATLADRIIAFHEGWRPE